jgi:hypothetical protein
MAAEEIAAVLPLEPVPDDGAARGPGNEAEDRELSHT